MTSDLWFFGGTVIVCLGPMNHAFSQMCEVSIIYDTIQPNYYVSNLIERSSIGHALFCKNIRRI